MSNKTTFSRKTATSMVGLGTAIVIMIFLAGCSKQVVFYQLKESTSVSGLFISDDELTKYTKIMTAGEALKVENPPLTEEDIGLGNLRGEGESKVVYFFIKESSLDHFSSVYAASVGKNFVLAINGRIEYIAKVLQSRLPGTSSRSRVVPVIMNRHTSLERIDELTTTSTKTVDSGFVEAGTNRLE